MRKSLTWAAVGTTLVAAALSVAGTASAATATVKPTSLSIEKSVASIKAGEAVTISGQLKSGATALDRQAVVLDWVGPAGHLHYITTGTTSGPTGNVSFKRLHPTATTTYELVFNSAAGYARSHSGEARVWVSKNATKLAVAESATTVTVGTTVTLSGTLTAAGKDLTGKTVFLDTVGKGGHLSWTHRTAGTGTTGTAKFNVKPGATTTYELVFAGTWQYAASKSAPAKVTVNKVPTTLVAVEAAGTTAGTETITGTLSGPTGLVGKAVSLQYKNGKGVWVTLRSKSTGTGGIVVFTVEPKAATTYRLVFTSTPVYTAAISNTVIAG
jgi:hypothetical protein